MAYFLNNFFTNSYKTHTQTTGSSKQNLFKAIEPDYSQYEFFTCPECKERISIILNPEKYNLSYTCSNNHTETNISYSDFLSSKYISTKKIINCSECEKEILDCNDVLCCKDCKKKICGSPNCILLHKKNNSHCNYIYPNELLNKCKKHNLDISHYCKFCNKNLCVFCFKEKENKNIHQNHFIINFKDLLPKDEDITNNKNLLNEKINLNNEIKTKIIKWKNEIIEKIDNIINLIESESKINKLIINNFDWKYFDYNYYNSYLNASKNIMKYNSKFIEQLMQSNNFKDNSTAIINLLNNLNEKNDEQNSDKEEELLDILNKGKKIYLGKNFSFIIENDYKTKYEIDNKINFGDNIYNNLINFKENLFNKIPNINILLWKKDSNLFEACFNKKNKIDNNFSIFFEAKKTENKSNSGNLLFETTSQSNSLFNFGNLNASNRNNINSTYYNSSIDNNILYQESEEYVYVSRTGCKFHGRPTCGRMKSSTKMTLIEAKRMGLTPCMKCY